MADVSAVPKIFKLGDRELALHPFSDKDMAELENWARSTLVERAFAAIPANLTTGEIRQIRSDIAVEFANVTILDKRLHVLLVSPVGIVKMCAIGIRKDENAKDVTEEMLRKQFQDTTNITRWLEAHNEQNPNFIKAQLRKPPDKGDMKKPDESTIV